VVTEALVRRRYFAAMREAAVQLWGENGLAAIAGALPEDVRRQTADAMLVPEEWLPATSAMAWFTAVWETCAARKAAEMAAFIDCQTGLGFGRVRKFFLSQATPALVIARAAKLWRDDNTAGEIVTISQGEGRVVAELRDHVYATTPLSRLVVTELLRSVLARCRAKDVTARGLLGPDGALRMSFTWSNG
jgi:hypothetical protein